MFESEFLKMMPHVVTISPRLGRDRNNDLTFGDPVEYKARISGKVLSLRRQMTQDETPIFDIYLGARITEAGEFLPITKDDAFTVEDKVELPNEPAWVDVTPAVFAIGRITDEDGHHHVKMQCGWMYHRQGQ